MPQDAVNYMFLAEELNEKLAKGRIEKITMDEKANVMLFIHANGKTNNLLITTSASPRCYITAQRIQAPAVPLSFTLHLRKHIGNGVIEKVECEPFERILRFRISSKDDLGDVKSYILIVELMGKYSNVVLASSDLTITDALKHIPISESHPILPGLKYEMPTFADKPEPTSEKADMYSDLSDMGELINRVRGLAQVTAREILHIASEEGITLSEAASRLMERKPRPVVYYGEDGEAVEYSFSKFDSVPYKSAEKDSLSEAMDCYFLPRDAARAFEGELSKLKRIIGALLDRHKRKLGSFLDEENASRDYEKERLLGELITANIYKIKKGDGLLKTVNWETGEEVSVKLTESTPQEDAQKHFRRYQKKKRTIEALSRQIESAREEIDYLESIADSLENAAGTDDLKEIRAEMESMGLIPVQKTRKKESESQPRLFEIDGFTVAVGKSNIQNDKITKAARGEDIWLHTQGIHGSHVIIRTNGRQVTAETLEKAAAVAAFFSKARNSDNVPVDYTRIKNVHKPKGAVPGKVDYFSAKTLFVRPSLP